MPHLFVNRPRLHDVIKDNATAKDQFRWETINAVVYKLGGLIFVIGSVLFFPSMEAYADVGAWVFILGSLLYLVVTGHDVVEVVEHSRHRHGPAKIWDRLEAIAAAAYLLGTILFTVGSVFFLSAVGLFTAGAWCFVIGSLLFVLGATVNVLQIVQAANLVTLQLMNLTALTFVTGSVLFTVASIPYLWSIDTPHDKRIIDAFLAWQFVAGSVLFLLGGIFNYWRAWVVVREKMAEQGDLRGDGSRGVGLLAIGQAGSVDVPGIALIPCDPLGAHPMKQGARLAPAWLLKRSPNIFVIPGTTSIKHLEENWAAWDLFKGDLEAA